LLSEDTLILFLPTLNTCLKDPGGLMYIFFKFVDGGILLLFVAVEADLKESASLEFLAGLKLLT
jgi:hypothetical protein